MQRRLLLAVWLSALLFSQSVVANPLHQELARVLRLDEVASILRKEGLTYGGDIDTSILEGKGGGYFYDQVSALYDENLIKSDLETSLAGNMSDNEIGKIIAFFETTTGQRILSLENSARVAMADQAVEDEAREAYKSLLGQDDPHLTEVERFIQSNDLVNRNVNSALAANFHFYRGLAEGEGVTMGEDEMLAYVWAGESELREDTAIWMSGFLLMAYKPLELEELRAYVAFSETPSGQSLNRALFLGFDQIYNAISYKLGLAVAQAMMAQDI